MAWTTNPTKPIACLHAEVAIQTRNVQFRNSNLHYLEVIGHCNECKKHVTFLGVSKERRDLNPSGNGDGSLIRLPFICDGDELKL